MKIIKKAFFVLFTAGIFFLAGCASSPKNEKDAYYEENVKDFSKYELKNGIPVIFKKTNGGQVFVLRTVFEGILFRRHCNLVRSNCSSKKKFRTACSEYLRTKNFCFRGT